MSGKLGGEAGQEVAYHSNMRQILLLHSISSTFWITCQRSVYNQQGYNTILYVFTNPSTKNILVSVCMTTLSDHKTNITGESSLLSSLKWILSLYNPSFITYDKNMLCWELE